MSPQVRRFARRFLCRCKTMHVTHQSGGRTDLGADSSSLSSLEGNAVSKATRLPLHHQMSYCTTAVSLLIPVSADPMYIVSSIAVLARLRLDHPLLSTLGTFGLSPKALARRLLCRCQTMHVTHQRGGRHLSWSRRPLSLSSLEGNIVSNVLGPCSSRPSS